MITIYTDGSCAGNPGPGGWAALVLQNGQRRAISGGEGKTTNNRMEMTAAIKGLEATPDGAEVTVFSDSQYLINTMTRGWKRNANSDLWSRLDELVSHRKVRWEWVQGHAGNPENEEVDRLAVQGMKTAAGKSPSATGFTHLDSQGRAQMVDVGDKADTLREAVAKGAIRMSAEVLAKIQQGQVEKGDVFSVARIAGINAAKRTWELIPLCHQIPLSHVAVDLAADSERSAVDITATVRTTYKTGVEMEALTAVAVAALTIYDMCKAMDRAMRIERIGLVRKSGGRSGKTVLEW